MQTFARAIPGFPKYSVNESGRIFGPRKELAPCSDRRGYKRVWVYRDGKRFELYVHRAVALAWVKRNSSLTVNHLDFDKNNNHASNLEWCENIENMRHSFRFGPHARRKSGKRGKSYAIPHELLNRLFQEIESGKSIRSVARCAGVGRATLQYQYKLDKNGGLP